MPSGLGKTEKFSKVLVSKCPVTDEQHLATEHARFILSTINIASPIHSSAVVST